MYVVADPRDPPTKWHSIRPSHPRLALSIMEMTSVLATFVVSSLSSSILRHHDDFDPNDVIPTSSTDTLSKGISVNVNGTPWRQCRCCVIAPDIGVARRNESAVPYFVEYVTGCADVLEEARAVVQVHGEKG